MPVWEGDEGALIIEPQGDILFCSGYPADDAENFIELVIARPGETHEPGTLHPERAGQTTADVMALVRIRMTPAVCAIMIERIALIQTELLGMPPLIPRPESEPSNLRVPTMGSEP